VAASVARFTSALWTPSMRDSAFSTCRTQEAQVMPPISRVQMEVVATVIVVPYLEMGGCGYGMRV
jgi:hypothetical protein